MSRTSYDLPAMNNLLAEMRDYREYCVNTIARLHEVQGDLAPTFEGELARLFFDRLEEVDIQLANYIALQQKVADLVGTSSRMLDQFNREAEQLLRGSR